MSGVHCKAQRLCKRKKIGGLGHHTSQFPGNHYRTASRELLDRMLLRLVTAPCQSPIVINLRVSVPELRIGRSGTKAHNSSRSSLYRYIFLNSFAVRKTPRTVMAKQNNPT